MLASISSVFTSAIGDYGLYAVFALMALDAILPMSSELVMLYGGALAAGAFATHGLLLFGATIPTGAPALVAIGLAGTIGYTLGAVVGWAIGARAGPALLERHGRMLHVSPQRRQRAYAWFDRFGHWAVLIGRVTPLMRSFISIPAGALGSPFGSYTALTVMGSLLWAFPLAALGYGAGNGYTHVEHSLRYVGYGVLALAVGAGSLFVAARVRRARRAPS